MDRWDFIEEAGPSTSSIKEKFPNGSAQMEFDDDVDFNYSDSEDEVDCALQELDKGFLKGFCKKASTAFFEQYGLISHQINSYNDFVKYGIQQVFDSVGEIMIEPGYDPSKRGDGEWRRATLKFGKVTLDHPTFWTGEKFSSADGAKEFLELLPRHAHLQNMTYSSKIKVETHLQVYTEGLSRSDKFKTGVDKVVEKTILNEYRTDVNFGRLPVMVKSDLCWMSRPGPDGEEQRDCEFDQGGYFVIKGAEKTFIAQEQICLKRLWVAKDPTWTIAYRPVSKRKRVYIKLVPKVEHLIAGDKILTAYFYVTEVPVWLLFFALGVPNDREVVKLIGLDSDEDSAIANILVPSIYDADKKFGGFRKAGNAIENIKKLMQGSKFPPTETVDDLITTYLFPNLRSRRQKASFLAYMVKCLLEAYRGRHKVDNRDDLRNKRVELAGELLERELRVHIKHAERRMVKAIQRDLYKDREVQTIDHYLDASIVTNGLSRAFSTGAWVHPYKRMERISGVVANLRRTNPLQAVCDMRRTRQQVSYTGRVGDARYPHPSHWGKVCFLSTPDGENCGLVKNLASLGLVSTNILEQESILKKFYDCGMENLVDDDSCLLDSKHKVFLDGDWVGVCKDSSSFVAKLRRKRRKMEVPHQIEIKRDKHRGEVRIFADAGRILRPLFVVQNLKRIKDLKGEFLFQSLLDNGIVEFIGPEEEEDCQTAWGTDYLFTAELDNPPVKYTHCEFDSSFLLGLSCGIIPFANHDHARRVLYQSAKHSQQAIGYSTTNPGIRVDTNSHQLYYPQRPLFRTMLSDCLGKSRYSEHHKGMMPRPDFFNGQCAIVAVNVHLGYNQEDSLVMNRASLERGMFRTEHVRSYKAEVENSEAVGKRPKSDEFVTFGKMQSKIGRVDSLDDDGFPYIGANLQTGDIVIGKHAASGVDHSIKLKHTERGMVQKVVLSANDEGKNFAVVSLRQVRAPCLGDKFSSMHGQKGVLGFLESQENFPFTIDGIVPDIVINPHAFPSRQTPGQLLEAALGKGIALKGGLKYATPFSTPSVEDITTQLHRLGFSRWGGERVYDGRTGEKVESLIFMGPTFYQRLTHMAEDKVKFRNTGPVHPLTRQPVADRKRFGGIKFGEMERDCLIAHGAAANLHERLFTLSDSSQMHICRKCKNMANVIQRPVFGGRKIRGPYCRFCESVEDVVRVNVPYGAKLLCQELFSMGISLKFETELC
ncbi:DNA-directed RNA polymerases IV and V subunit 2-like [Salvia miltiorrhiza]|uniref:DNA-directed RNA polymerases IV and V subunit 2-like n=1 Tax=Salvia miltiorrhiza TaxID=226208 RepID=UPI0025AD2780|nr:DNA-directed RNA polymerases IV and V subunit 2-like [Salvia miltiorrhiza]XP_057784631.1 DNA-directed RNA polymerases IV and V subunit 2-like [Salvia miltiorrhiza]XP_057784632.1 DNA-directed RNA polymerases IV and V subunit 2-like [Salvia miltiorrhiza]